MSLQALAFCADNEAAIKDFGIARSKPIETGFFFWKYKYIPPPYVFERRGLDVYLNDIQIGKGMEWPPYDYAVKEDPGEPPPGTSPLDPSTQGVDNRDDYWARKYRYIYQHNPRDKANDMIVELYSKCPKITKIVREGPESLLVSAQGREPFYWVIGDTADDRIPPEFYQETVLKTAAFDYDLAKGTLERDGMFCQGAFLYYCDPESARSALEVLCSDLSINEKLAKLEELQVPGDLDKRSYILNFVATDELRSRVSVLKNALNKKQEQKLEEREPVPRRPLPAATETAPIVPISSQSDAGSPARNNTNTGSTSDNLRRIGAAVFVVLACVLIALGRRSKQ